MSIAILVVNSVQMLYCCYISCFRTDNKKIQDNMEVFDDENLLGKVINTTKRKTQVLS